MRCPLKYTAFGLGLLVTIILGSSAVQDTGLSTVSPYAVTAYGSSVRQYRSVGGVYENAWTSESMGDVAYYRCQGSGDLDNDGEVEIYSVVTYLSRTVKIDKKTTRNYYKLKLLVYESGVPVGGPPSWSVDDLEGGETTVRAVDCIAADVDGVPGTELVVLVGSHVDILDLTGGGLLIKGRSRAFGVTIFTVDAGDADNDGRNEIVLSAFTTGAPYILKFNGADGTFTETLAEPVPAAYYGKRLSFLGLDYARVRDADNLADITRDNVSGLRGNEIVGGGNNNRLMVWKHDPLTGDYRLEFISADLGHFTQGVDAGDINGDGENEIVIGNCTTVKVYPYLWVFSYDRELATYALVSKTRIESGRLESLEIGNMDVDAAAEVVVAAEGFRVFDFTGADMSTGSLVQTYFNAAGGPSEIH